ncbi:hypothetical protein FACS189465_1220 [Clostridia bacterium]|nr:hypothetical protein FACS189465_1220 [Clostridia bacterium]
MNEKLEIISDEIKRNDYLLGRVCEAEDFDELYRIFTFVGDGYTRDEFEIYFMQKLNVGFESLNEQHEDSELDLVSGGKSSPTKRTMAALLTMLSLGAGSNLVTPWGNSGAFMTASAASEKKIKLPEFKDLIADIQQDNRIEDLGSLSGEVFVVDDGRKTVKVHNRWVAAGGGSGHEIYVIVVNDKVKRFLESVYRLTQRENPSYTWKDIVRNQSFRDMVTQMCQFSFHLPARSVLLGDSISTPLEYIESFALEDFSAEAKANWDELKNSVQDITGKYKKTTIGALAMVALGVPLLLAKKHVASAYNGAAYAVKKGLKRFVYNRKTIGSDAVILRRNLEARLKTKLIGQDEPIEQFCSTISGVVEGWGISARAGTQSVPALITLLGPPGTGKTEMVRQLSREVFGTEMLPWQFISANTVQEDKSAEGLSPADRIFNADTELIRQLELNPNVVVCFDDVDKMDVNDPKNTMLERWRDAKTTGKLLVRDGKSYRYIDVSHAIVVFTSNELDECWGLPVKHLTESQKAGRTSRERDQSLTTRFVTISMNYLDVPAYTTILNKELEIIKKDVEIVYKIGMSFDEKLIEKLAYLAVEKNKGARGIGDFMIDLNGALVSYRLNNPNFSETEIMIDHKNNIFTCTDIGD